MPWEPRPVPERTPETAAFWDRTLSGELALCECENCGLLFFYPRAHCPDCFEADISLRPAAGTGDIYSCTTMDSLPGWPDDALPLTIAMVELDEGPRLVTNVVDSPLDIIRVGARVEVVFQDTVSDVAIPTFTVRS